MKDVLAQLAFYSEADLQHSLARTLDAQNPAGDIRLEYPANLKGQTAYIDLVARNGGSVTAIELKYKTCGTTIAHNGEIYALRRHGAYPLGRYDFIKDIERLESFVATTRNAKGFAIFIANDSAYWKPPQKPNAIDAEFRIYDTRFLAN